MNFQNYKMRMRQKKQFYDTLTKINKEPERLKQLINQSSDNIQKIFCIVSEFVQIINRQSDPLIKVNALYALLKFGEQAQYPFLILVQVYLTPSLYQIAYYSKNKEDYNDLASYFQHNGFSKSIKNLQNLSYNYVSLACEILSLFSFVKPKKINQNEQYNENSLFKKYYSKGIFENIKILKKCSMYSKNEMNQIRVRFLKNLVRFAQNTQDYLLYFMKKVEISITDQDILLKDTLDFKQILRYGDLFLTSDIISLISQNLSYNHNFDIKLKSLKLLNEFIIWGDIQALLVINYTQYIQYLVKNISKVRGFQSLEYGKDIFAQIPEQYQEKFEFYCEFLKCLQFWAQSFPNDYYLKPNQQNQQQSPINIIYKFLKLKKRFIFPRNYAFTQMQKTAHQNFIDKTQRNLVILADVNNQTQFEVESIFESEISLTKMKQYYEQNMRKAQELHHKKYKDSIHDNMKSLKQFSQNFELLFENIQFKEEEEEDGIDDLIEKGFQLIDLVEMMGTPYKELLKRQITNEAFIKMIQQQHYRWICQKDKEKNKSSYYLKVKKQNIKNILQTSILSKQLKSIQGSESSKSLSSKYKNRNNRKSSNRSNSDRSSLSLNMLSRTNFFDQKKKQPQLPIVQKKSCINKELQSMFSLSSQSKKSENDSKSRKKIEVTAPLKYKSSLSSSVNREEIFEQSSSSHKTNKKLKSLRQSKTNSSVDTEFNKNSIYSFGKNQKQINTSGEAKTLSTNNDTDKKMLKSYKDSVLPQFQVYSFMKKHNNNNYQTVQQANKVFVEDNSNTLIDFNYFKQYYDFLKSSKEKLIKNNSQIYKGQLMEIHQVFRKINQDNNIDLKIQIYISAKADLNLKIQFIAESSILIKQSSQQEFSIKQNEQKRLFFVGRMIKFPMNLPKICLKNNQIKVLQYQLPFTINNFLEPIFIKNNYLAQVSNILGKEKQYLSQKRRYSKVLFQTKQKIIKIKKYLQNSIEIKEKNNNDRIFLWKVKFQSSILLLKFSLDQKEDLFQSSGFIENGLRIQDQSLLLSMKYIINFFCHLFSQEQ